MRIKTLHGMVGPEINLNEGEVVDVDEKFGRQLIERGLAESYTEPEARRVATPGINGPSRTATREPKQRRGA